MGRSGNLRHVLAIVTCAAIAFGGLALLGPQRFQPSPTVSGSQLAESAPIPSIAERVAIPSIFDRIGAWIDVHHDAVTAGSTAVIAIFTIALALVTFRQARLTDQIIGLSRADLISTHRPKIIMRRLYLRPMEIGKPPTVQYDLANVGGSTAFIVAFEYTMWVGSGGVFTDVVGNREYAQTKEEGLAIRAGEAVQASVTGKMSLTKANIDQINSTTKTAGINFVGVLAYRDELGIKRRTAFWRRYEPSKGQRFAACDDPDYEYAD